METELVWSGTPGTAPRESKAQDWYIEMEKEVAVGLAPWGYDKFSQVGENLPPIKLLG